MQDQNTLVTSRQQTKCVLNMSLTTADKVISNWQSVYHLNKQLVQLVVAIQKTIVNVNKSQSYLAEDGGRSYDLQIFLSRGETGPLPNRVLLGATWVSLPNGISFRLTEWECDSVSLRLWAHCDFLFKGRVYKLTYLLYLLIQTETQTDWSLYDICRNNRNRFLQCRLKRTHEEFSVARGGGWWLKPKLNFFQNKNDSPVLYKNM